MQSSLASQIWQFYRLFAQILSAIKKIGPIFQNAQTVFENALNWPESNIYVNDLARVCSVSVLLAFGKDLIQLNDFFFENLIIFKSSKRQEVLLCLILDGTDCCRSYKLSRVRSPFLPRCLKAAEADGVVGINTRLDVSRQTQRERQQNKLLCSKLPQCAGGKTGRVIPTLLHGRRTNWCSWHLLSSIKWFITYDLMVWNPLLSADD